jgi:ATP-dependent RNA circularization protein (DNA/RNA ligase family)
MTDEMKLKKLAKFKKDFQKLMDKYPDIMVYGDMHGDVTGYIDLQHPRVENKHGNITLTYQGKVL